MRADSGIDTAGLVARDPQQLDRAGLGVAEDLHGVRWAAPSAGSCRSSTFHSRASSSTWAGLLPVAEARQVTVGAALAVVLRGRLAVHLQEPAAGAADHPAEQMQVVAPRRMPPSPGATGRSPAGRSTGPGRDSPKIRAARRTSVGVDPADRRDVLGRVGLAPPARARPRRGCAGRPSPRRPSRWRTARGSGRSSGRGWYRPAERDARRRYARPPRRPAYAEGRRRRSTGGSSPRVRSRMRDQSTVWVSAMLWP